jgi:hypothetical protein
MKSYVIKGKKKTTADINTTITHDQAVRVFEGLLERDAPKVLMAMLFSYGLNRDARAEVGYNIPATFGPDSYLEAVSVWENRERTARDGAALKYRKQLGGLQSLIKYAPTQIEAYLKEQDAECAAYLASWMEENA